MFLKKLTHFSRNLLRIFCPPRSISLGEHGERLACRFLKKKKYKIFHRNWRYKHAELDIIACDGDVVVFIEVRLRNKNALVRGIESISKQKRSALRRACYAYLKKYSPHATTYRFDVVDIEHDNDSGRDVIHHFENIQIF